MKIMEQDSVDSIINDAALEIEKAEAKATMDSVESIINDAAINTPGIVLDFRVTPATVAGSNNTISILASHATVDVINVNRTIPKYVDVAIPPNTERVDLYYRTTGNWTYFASGTSSRIPYTNAGLRPEIMAIGRNGTFSGLESFPGRIGYPPDPLGFPGTKK